MIDNLEAPLGRNRMLSGLDLFIDKLDHFIRINIDHVIVVIVGRQLKNGVARLKVVSYHQNISFRRMHPIQLKVPLQVTKLLYIKVHNLQLLV